MTKNPLRNQTVRGVEDHLPEQAEKFYEIQNKAYLAAQKFGCRRIQTPIFEFSEIFHRTLGETSDVVSKETYTFSDRGGESLTLRPEGTAGIARAFINHSLHQQLPLKFFYYGPMFRYERPQAGRLRQFHQIGVEFLGAEHPLLDVECISLAHETLMALGIRDFKLELNSLGDKASRAAHREALIQYLNQFKDSLSLDSQTRLEKNPLRILDSKDPGDKKIVEGAPDAKSFFTAESKNFWDKVKEGLSALNIPFTENKNLVRGLDYYSHTVFEFTSDQLGAQSTILGGGRYDGLIEIMGGPATPAVGWASGVERLYILLKEHLSIEAPKKVAFLASNPLAELELIKQSALVRAAGFSTELIFGDQAWGKKFKRADKLLAQFAVILGEDELKTQQLSVKNLKTGNQKLIPSSELTDFLRGD